jgi:methylmalonyl-CoA/ethylmalonyl-CoA epimerase
MVNAEQGVRLAYLDLGNGKIELIEPLRPDSPVSKFLERNPKGGIHHLCLGVEDVEAAARALAQNGVRVLGEGRPQRNVAGAAIAFIHPGDFLGALVELEQHKA